MGKSYLLAVLIKLSFHLESFSPFHGTTAPSNILNRLSGITRSSSIPKTWLKPSQTGQAPKGLLNENRLGTGSSNTIPSSSNLLEKGNHFSLLIRSVNSPSPSYKAVPMESEIRSRASSSNS